LGVFGLVVDVEREVVGKGELVIERNDEVRRIGT
jgi:hypothetical protein